MSIHCLKTVHSHPGDSVHDGTCTPLAPPLPALLRTKSNLEDFVRVETVTTQPDDLAASSQPSLLRRLPSVHFELELEERLLARTQRPG